jgi:hypothetical protein
MSAFLSVDLLTEFAAFCLTDFIDWRYTHSWFVQGGSDKSGILILFFLNDTSHLKTIRFYPIKNRLAEKHTENPFIQ